MLSVRANFDNSEFVKKWWRPSKKAGERVADLDDDELRTIGFEREEAERAEQEATEQNLYNFKG